MAYFAKIESDTVTEVIVAEQAHIDTLSGTWVETSLTGSTRKNYAQIGGTYDSSRDAFISPKPYSSWTLEESTCQWVAPSAYPSDDKNYDWNEGTTSWVEEVIE
tara:strand:- start:1030 stop:1341 length:312 start_codon:yes stop_codon:yes gene_type:complete